MAAYDYLPQTFDGQSLISGNLTVLFARPNSPIQTRRFRPVEASVTGLGDRDVRAQPQGTNWELDVRLATLNQTDLDAFYKVFDEERGLSFLVANDGDGVAWRVACRVVQVMSEGPGIFRVILRVPDPTWEEDSATSDDQTAISTSPKTWNLTNNGNRKVKPKFTISHDVGKVNAVDGYKTTSRGFRFTRTKLPWNNEPVHLGTIDHGALVTDTSKSNQINEVGGIDASQTTIDIDTAVGGGLPTTPGMAVIESEQIYYTANSGTQLTDVVRGIGGTTAATHAENVVVTMSRSLKDGNDVRVYLNGVEVERWFEGVNTTTAELWINATMPARVKLTLVEVMTSSVPASGGDLQLVEGVADLPERGAVVVENEIISYQSRDIADRKLKTIERGAWRTTAASHAITKAVYRADLLYVVALNKGKAGVPISSIEHRPAIQLSDSSNLVWKWGDEVADSDMSFYDSDHPNRSAMWRPSLETADRDKNNAEAPPAAVPANPKLQWIEDFRPPGLSQPVHRFVLSLPVGLGITASDMLYDETPRRWARTRILGRAADGIEKELVDSYDVDEAAATGIIVPTQLIPLHEIIISEVRATITGQPTETELFIGSAVNFKYIQKFILDQDSEIEGFVVKMRKDGAGDDFDLQYRIRDDSASDPKDGNPILLLTGPANAAALTTSDKHYILTDSRGEIVLQAGTYWLEIDQLNWVSGKLRPLGGRTKTKSGPLRTIQTGNPSVISPDVIHLRIIHTHGGPVQQEAEAFQIATIPVIDKVVITLADTGNDPQTLSGGETALTDSKAYHITGVLENLTTGQKLTLDVWTEDSVGTLEIDCEARTVVALDGNHRLPVVGGVVFSDGADWLDLDPGVNNMKYTDASIGRIAIKTDYRGKKV